MKITGEYIAQTKHLQNKFFWSTINNGIENMICYCIPYRANRPKANFELHPTKCPKAPGYLYMLMFESIPSKQHFSYFKGEF